MRLRQTVYAGIAAMTLTTQPVLAQDKQLSTFPTQRSYLQPNSGGKSLIDSATENGIFVFDVGYKMTGGTRSVYAEIKEICEGRLTGKTLAAYKYPLKEGDAGTWYFLTSEGIVSREAPAVPDGRLGLDGLIEVETVGSAAEIGVDLFSNGKIRIRVNGCNQYLV